MRPAQKAPENPKPKENQTFDLPRFNEAGAKSAGKLDVHPFDADDRHASMRPAQKAPENVVYRKFMAWTDKLQ